MLNRHLFAFGNGKLGFFSEADYLTIYLILFRWIIVRRKPKDDRVSVDLDFSDLSFTWFFESKEQINRGRFSLLDLLFGKIDWYFEPQEEPWTYHGLINLELQRGLVSRNRPVVIWLQRRLGLLMGGFTVKGWMEFTQNELLTFHYGEPDVQNLTEIAHERTRTFHDPVLAISQIFPKTKR